MMYSSTLLRWTSAFCIAALFSSCASAPQFDAKKELHVNDHWASGRHLIQDNKIIDQRSAYQGLKSNASTESAASSAQTLEISSRLLGAAGVIGVTYGLAVSGPSSSKSEGAGWWIAGGAVAILIAGLLNDSAGTKLKSAAEIHNSELQKGDSKITPAPKKSAEFKLLPNGLALHF